MHASKNARSGSGGSCGLLKQESSSFFPLRFPMGSLRTSEPIIARSAKISKAGPCERRKSLRAVIASFHATRAAWCGRMRTKYLSCFFVQRATTIWIERASISSGLESFSWKTLNWLHCDKWSTNHHPLTEDHGQLRFSSGGLVFVQDNVLSVELSNGAARHAQHPYLCISRQRAVNRNGDLGPHLGACRCLLVGVTECVGGSHDLRNLDPDKRATVGVVVSV